MFSHTLGERLIERGIDREKKREREKDRDRCRLVEGELCSFPKMNKI